MSQTLLVIGAGIEAVPGILTARQMGLNVICSDADGEAPGFAVANHRLVVSTYDAAGTLAAASDYQANHHLIDGVMCIACDCFLTVARVAEGLSLPGIPYESARLLASKLAMKQKFLEAGVAVPWFQQVGCREELKKLAGAKGFPLVLKPVDSRGARGVLRLTSGIDLEWAYEFSLGASPGGQLILEEFLPGPQVSTESLVVDGVVYTPGFSDRNYECLERFAPHIIENGGELPSCLDPVAQERVRRLVEEAIRCLGIRNGTIKGDIVVSGGKPYVIELAPRLSGGYFCTHEIPLNTGVDFVAQAIRLALGQRPLPENLTARCVRAVAQRYMFPSPGRVVAVEGEQEASRQDGIELCEVRVRPGDMVSRIDSHPARSGVVIATGESRLQAIERASQAVNSVRIKTSTLD